MNIELTYCLTNDIGEIIDFSSFLINDAKKLNKSLFQIYNDSPTFTDRNSGRNSQRHQIELADLIMVINYIEEVYSFDNIKIFFNYQNNNHQLEISVLNFSNNIVHKNINKPTILKNNGNSITTKATYSMNIRLTYQSVDNLLENKTLTKNSRAIAICLAKSNRPLSRGEILKRIDCLPRTATNSLNRLVEKGIVTNTNRTRSPKFNKYLFKN